MPDKPEISPSGTGIHLRELTPEERELCEEIMEDEDVPPDEPLDEPPPRHLTLLK